MDIVFTNYSDDSIALLHYLNEQGQATLSTTVVSIDTGWAAPRWKVRVRAAQAYVESLGFSVKRLEAQPNFEALVKQRKHFPNKKFQWCAGLLKGITLLHWLDVCDPSATARIILAKRREQSRANFDLPEFIDASEHFGQRRIWHPIVTMTTSDCRQRLQQAGFELWAGRSLECDPCIHSTTLELLALEEAAVERVAALEQALGQPMFLPGGLGSSTGIEAFLLLLKNQTIPDQVEECYHNRFDMGCGSPFACGV